MAKKKFSARGRRFGRTSSGKAESKPIFHIRQAWFIFKLIINHYKPYSVCASLCRPRFELIVNINKRMWCVSYNPSQSSLPLSVSRGMKWTTQEIMCLCKRMHSIVLTSRGCLSHSSSLRGREQSWKQHTHTHTHHGVQFKIQLITTDENKRWFGQKTEL